MRINVNKSELIKMIVSYMEMVHQFEPDDFAHIVFYDEKMDKLDIDYVGISYVSDDSKRTDI